MGRMGWLALLVVAAWSGAWRRAMSEEQARAHFEAGHAMFRLERYADAAREFQAGYDLVPKPRFLLNLGHALRRMGLHERAKATYEKFLASVPADDPNSSKANKLPGRGHTQAGAGDTAAGHTAAGREPPAAQRAAAHRTPAQ